MPPGTATVIVTGTGQSTQMGHIAGMVSSVERSKSPLQQELDGMTKVFGFIAWGAVAIIAVAGAGLAPAEGGEPATDDGAAVFDQEA